MSHHRPSVPCICINCWATFLIEPYRVGEAKYCGWSCRSAHFGRHRESGVGKRTPEYNAWLSMLRRCFNPKDKGYPNYGGRGISVCDSWRKSFESFLADVGRRPSAQHSINRIDNNQGYEPGNVTWSTHTEQQRNRRANRLITFDGLTRCMAEWAEVTGLSPERLNQRLKRGWTVERALTTPAGAFVRGDSHPACLHPERLKRGEGHPRATFTDDQIREIRRAAGDGIRQVDIAIEHGRSRGVIGGIVRRQSWAHV